MAKASKCYTGGRYAVGTPTLNKSNYYQLIRSVRKAKEEHGIGQRKAEEPKHEHVREQSVKGLSAAETEAELSR